MVGCVSVYRVECCVFLCMVYRLWECKGWYIQRDGTGVCVCVCERERERGCSGDRELAVSWGKSRPVQISKSIHC